LVVSGLSPSLEERTPKVQISLEEEEGGAGLYHEQLAWGGIVPENTGGKVMHLVKI
jgi:hypothetical protein